MQLDSARGNTNHDGVAVCVSAAVQALSAASSIANVQLQRQALVGLKRLHRAQGHKSRLRTVQVRLGRSCTGRTAQHMTFRDWSPTTGTAAVVA